jgi:hypothetical protein
MEVLHRGGGGGAGGYRTSFPGGTKLVLEGWIIIQ